MTAHAIAAPVASHGLRPRRLDHTARDGSNGGRMSTAIAQGAERHLQGDRRPEHAPGAVLPVRSGPHRSSSPLWVETSGVPAATACRRVSAWTAGTLAAWPREKKSLSTRAEVAASTGSTLLMKTPEWLAGRRVCEPPERRRKWALAAPLGSRDAGMARASMASGPATKPRRTGFATGVRREFASAATGQAWPCPAVPVYPHGMNQTPPLDPWTSFFLDGIWKQALADFIHRSGLQVDVMAGALDRAAQAAEHRDHAEDQREGLRQAIAIAQNEARQMRLTAPKG